MSLARSVAAALVLATGLAVATTASGATPSTFEPGTEVEADQPAERVDGRRRVIMISDSAMAGLRWNYALAGLRGFDADDRLESCRRLVDQSCNGREGRRPITALAEVQGLDQAIPSDVLMIAVGYNDYDTRFAAQSRQVLDAARAKGFETIVWINYREDVTYALPADTNRAISNYSNMNAELRTIVASGSYPELIVWDQNAYTMWASSVFTPDGVHQLRYGSWLIADWLSRKMAELDGRPCPKPWTPTSPADAVCLDPVTLLSTRGYPSIGALYDI